MHEMHTGASPAKRALLAALGASLCAACAAAETTGARLEIAVAPLSLPGLSKVCYDLRVTNAANGAGSTVWSQGSLGLSPAGDADALCSTSYGNGPGGAITFVGACDASTGQNSVTLWVDGLYDTSAQFIPPSGSEGWQDPCPAGCTLNATCLENQDTKVEFNLAILRQANQGFFDIGVNFEDIFCSAKVDCVDGQGEPLELLFRNGQRDTTVVAAMACTAGPGAVTTELFRNDLDIVCDGGLSAALDPAVGKGNAWGAGATPDDPVWQYAIYSGDESLTCGGQSCQKQYWNVAIGLDTNADNCHLRTTMTAAKLGQLDFVTPTATTWPYIDVDVQLTDASGLACTTHPLNGGNGVVTRYTPIADPVEFEHSLTQDTFSAASLLCSPACQNGGTCGPNQVCICPANTAGATCEILVPQDDVDGAAFIAAAPISDATQQAAIMRLVYDLKQAGIWSKMKAVYPFVGGTAARHKYNLKDPRDLDAAFRLTFSGSWSHTATGARPSNGGYANTFLVQTAQFSSIASQHYSFYSRTEIPVGNGWNIGVGDANDGDPLYGIALKRNANDALWANALIYDNGNYTQSGRLLSSETDARAFYIATGTSLTSRKFFKNRSLVNASTSSPTGAMVSHSYYIGCINNLGTAAYCLDNEVAFASIGDGLTDAEVMAFHDAVQRFNTTLNRHVGVPLGSAPRPAPGLIAELDARNPDSYDPTVGGSTWYDLLGFSNGTISGALWSSLAGGTFNFDGNDHVDLGRSLNAYIGDNLPITFEIMVYLNPSNSDEYFIGNNWDTSGFHIRKTGSSNAPANRIRYLFLQRNGAVLNFLGLDSGALSAGWYHIVALYNGQGLTTGSNLGLYVNGVSVGVSYSGGGRPYVNSARTVNLGRTSDGNRDYLNGRIPWLRVYDKALSAADITARFSAIRSTYGL